MREKARWLGKMLWKRGRMPEELTFFVTDRCDLSCAHCFHWERSAAPRREATLDEIDAVSRHVPPFSFLTLTGGEPFLRPDLGEIASCFVRNARVTHVDIPTNGSRPAHIADTTGRILAAHPDLGLSVKLSLDGTGDEHDRLRGAQGAFAAAMETWEALRALRARHRNLRIGVLMTYTGLNADSLRETFFRVVRRLEPDTVGLNFVRGRPRDPKAALADVQGYAALYREILEDRAAGAKARIRPSVQFRRAYKEAVARAIVRIQRERRAVSPCPAGRLFGMLDSELDVFPCELRHETMGSLRESGYDLGMLWRSPRADEVREGIATSHCYCTLECALQIGQFFSPPVCFGLILRALFPARAARPA